MTPEDPPSELPPEPSQEIDPEMISDEPLADQGRRKKRVSLKPFVVGAVIVLALALAYQVPIPAFFTEGPGPIRSVEPLIEIEGADTYSSEGDFYLTTVSIDTDVTLFELIGAAIDPDSLVILKSQLVPEGTSLEELSEQQQEQMAGSKQHAEEVAFAALGLGKPTGDGAKVLAVVEDYPAAEVLEPKDVIVRVNGQKVETTCEVGNAIDRLEPGDTVSITVIRDGKRRTFDIVTTHSPENPDAPFIGVHMEDVNYQFDPGVKVDIKTGNIAGPSAGLIFTLSLYDLLTPDDLTNGLKIAGTGEIACDGGVGPIGGIEQKVAAAEKEGVEVFLAPAANFAAAQAAAGDDIDVVSISTFNDALEYLEGLR